MPDKNRPTRKNFSVGGIKILKVSSWSSDNADQYSICEKK